MALRQQPQGHKEQGVLYLINQQINYSTPLLNAQ